MPEKSTRTTANEPIEAIDPGGTRPRPATGTGATEQKVASGDRNTRTSSTVTPVHKQDGNESKPT